MAESKESGDIMGQLTTQLNIASIVIDVAQLEAVAKKKKRVHRTDTIHFEVGSSTLGECERVLLSLDTIMRQQPNGLFLSEVNKYLEKLYWMLGEKDKAYIASLRVRANGMVEDAQAASDFASMWSEERQNTLDRNNSYAEYVVVRNSGMLLIFFALVMAYLFRFAPNYWVLHTLLFIQIVFASEYCKWMVDPYLHHLLHHKLWALRLSYLLYAGFAVFVHAKLTAWFNEVLVSRSRERQIKQALVTQVNSTGLSNTSDGANNPGGQRPPDPVPVTNAPSPS